MKVSGIPRWGRFIAAVLASAGLLVAAAQAPPQPAETGPGPQESTPSFPAPVNLKVLPRNLTGSQVHELMKQWASELGVRCVACHVSDSSAVIAGTSSPRFADDSKPMKETARLMYTMTEAINNGYIAKLEGSGMPVTCGTCHRGNVSPELFSEVPFDSHPPSHTPAQASRPPAR